MTVRDNGVKSALAGRHLAQETSSGVPESAHFHSSLLRCFDLAVECLPTGLMCLSTWSPGSAVVLKGCDTFGSWGLGGGSGSLQVLLQLGATPAMCVLHGLTRFCQVGADLDLFGKGES